ncbi:MAG: Sec-independent protein translocase protein TatB [Pseudomonadota bacterium]
MPFFDFGSLELLLIAVVALIVVGPKDLPKLMRAAGKMMSTVRGTARHFKAGVDEMIRQSELDEMQAKWQRHNQAIMDGPPARDLLDDHASDPAEALASPSPTDEANTAKGDQNSTGDTTKTPDATT